LDKVDEEPRLENDASEIAEFLTCLLCDNKLLLHADVQFLIACWSIPLEQMKSRVRFQKISLQRVTWSKVELLDILNQRLSIFSGGKLKSIYDLIDERGRADFDDILRLANGNPRDLWHLMDAILKSEYEIDQDSRKISEASLAFGARKFVEKFNFYEYYPRNAKARSNTMDVYSYIAHLQKLGFGKFTKNQLNEIAGTGSSTSNYVVAMENMGLISKSDSKSDSGAVVYEIRDPKVLFAMEKGIQISRTA